MAQTQIQAQSAIRHVEIAAKQRPASKFRWHHILVYALLIIFTFTSLGPFIFSFFSTFKTMQHILDFPPSLFPTAWTIDNYVEILGDPSFSHWLLNSAIFAVGVTVLNVFLSAMAGYALSRMRFRGREIIFVTTLAVMMIPMPVTIIPKYLIINNLHLINTYWALILPMMVQPFSVFLMVQFMKSLPKELEEAAWIDGASRWRTFIQIILPLVQPALTAVAIISFQGAWNEFIWSLLVLDSRDMWTLPVGLFQFKNAHYTQYNLLITSSMFNAIPVLILFFVFQRYFIEGSTAAAVKG